MSIIVWTVAGQPTAFVVQLRGDEWDRSLHRSNSFAQLLCSSLSVVAPRQPPDSACGNRRLPTGNPHRCGRPEARVEQAGKVIHHADCRRASFDPTEEAAAASGAPFTEIFTAAHTRTRKATVDPTLRSVIALSAPRANIISKPA